MNISIEKIDSAIARLERSRKTLDSVRADVNFLGRYAQNKKMQVDLIGAEKQLQEAKTSSEKQKVLKRIDSLLNNQILHPVIVED